MAATTDDMVVVATYDVPLAAAVAKNFLTAEGIPAVVADADVATVLPADAVGGAKVLVPAAYAATAALRIAAHDAVGSTSPVSDDDLTQQALSEPPEGE